MALLEPPPFEREDAGTQEGDKIGPAPTTGGLRSCVVVSRQFLEFRHKGGSSCPVCMCSLRDGALMISTYVYVSLVSIFHGTFGSLCSSSKHKDDMEQFLFLFSPIFKEDARSVLGGRQD